MLIKCIKDHVTKEPLTPDVPLSNMQTFSNSLDKTDKYDTIRLTDT